MITICPLCNVDTAGNHEWNCPNKPQKEHIAMATNKEILDAAAKNAAYIVKLETENSRLLDTCLAAGFIGNGTQIIGDKRYAELLKAETTLAALEAAGVDNWEGYDDALEGT